MEISMSSTKKKILEEILPLHIIREVEKWPVLYSRDCTEMPNTHFKNKVWNEIAKALIKDWDSYPQPDKNSTIADLSKKWRNLRDTFKRQLLFDKKRREGHDIKRKKYVYFKHMSFLLPHVQEPGGRRGRPRNCARACAPDCAPSRAPARAPAPAPPPAAAPPPPPAPQPAPAAAADLLDQIDEDKHFLMSLLPSFKRMNDDEKLTAKVEILKVIKDVRRQSVTTTMESYVCQLDLADEEQVAVKKEPFPDAQDFSECSG